eukprot:9217911-Pyramimonas_sp.AAC.1
MPWDEPLDSHSQEASFSSYSSSPNSTKEKVSDVLRRCNDIEQVESPRLGTLHGIDIYSVLGRTHYILLFRHQHRT